MIPLRDNIPHRRTPYVTIGLLVINVVIFLYELSLGQRLAEFAYLYGFVPASWGWPISVGAKIRPLLTNMFLHASFMHLAGNMLFLWIFADNVEDTLGHARFLVFYLLCGIGASLIHGVFNFGSKIPAVGASGAIAGVLGAYFVLFPQARVRTLVPLLFFWQIIELPAFIFLGFWFVYQFLFGLGSIGAASGIAFWAHIGGFVAGIVFLKIFLKMRYRYYSV